jgi:hypothetical protein
MAATTTVFATPINRVEILGIDRVAVEGDEVKKDVTFSLASRAQQLAAGTDDACVVGSGSRHRREWYP